MGKLKSYCSLLFIILMSNLDSFSQTIQYTMPAEGRSHEGTWLQWPHHYEYGTTYRDRLDATWIAMTQALIQSERVHIIAYNTAEQSRITTLLNNAGVNLSYVDFRLFPTNDVWVRDNGPIFVRNGTGNLVIQDWGFNGWGGKFNFEKCDKIPTEIGNALGIAVVDLNSKMVNEGGAVEIDGKGVLLACRSSILSQSPQNTVRNPGMTQAQAEALFTTNLGISKCIWLNGVAGAPDDVTDMHIDGFAHFANDSVIVTMNSTDLKYWNVPNADIATLYNATDINNSPYKFTYVPLTQNDVVTAYGKNLGYKGSYVNYYIANTVVLVPVYCDPNDTVAASTIQGLYTDRRVIGIDVRNLYENGGMVHCVAQQQPLDNSSIGFNGQLKRKIRVKQIFPNPFKEKAALIFALTSQSCIRLELYTLTGRFVATVFNARCEAGEHSIAIDAKQLSVGIYMISVVVDNSYITNRMMILSK